MSGEFENMQSEFQPDAQPTLQVQGYLEERLPESPRIVSRRRLRRDIIETLLVVVVIYTLVNLTTARAVVEGPSMQPNFYTGQLVVINRFAYYFARPARGDVVVLHSPRSECLTPDKIESTGCEDLIKRVIGLPGEKVEIKNGRVFINKTQIDEPYIQEFCKVGC